MEYPLGLRILDPNNCSGGEISWDVISSVTAEWNPDLENELTVTAVNDWADATQVSFEYDGMSYDMAWNGAGSHWELTVDADVYYDTIRVYSEAGGDLTTSVENQTPLPVTSLTTLPDSATAQGLFSVTGPALQVQTAQWAGLHFPDQPAQTQQGHLQATWIPIFILRVLLALRRMVWALRQEVPSTLKVIRLTPRHMRYLLNLTGT